MTSGGPERVMNVSDPVPTCLNCASIHRPSVATSWPCGQGPATCGRQKSGPKDTHVLIPKPVIMLPFVIKALCRCHQIKMRRWEIIQGASRQAQPNHRVLMSRRQEGQREEVSRRKPEVGVTRGSGPQPGKAGHLQKLEKTRNGISSRASGGTWPCQHHDFGPARLISDF